MGISSTRPLRAIDITRHKKIEASYALARELSIPVYVLGIYNHWIQVENKKYYYKQTRAAIRIVLEFLGEYISKYIGLDTVEYTLASDEKGICGLLSENYRKKGVEYVQSYQLTKDELKRIRRILSSPFLYKNDPLEEELAKYIVRNFYTNLGDRDANVLCKRVNGALHLTTLYDYESSFDFVDREIYTDKLFRKNDGDYLLINCEFIARLIRKSKIMRQYFEKMMDLNMNVTLTEIEDRNGIIISSELKDRFNEYDEKRKKMMLQKIAKKMK